MDKLFNFWCSLNTALNNQLSLWTFQKSQQYFTNSTAFTFGFTVILNTLKFKKKKKSSGFSLLQWKSSDGRTARGKGQLEIGPHNKFAMT